jgi:hypothetical protein
MPTRGKCRLQKQTVSKRGKRFPFHVDFGAIARGHLAGRHAAASQPWMSAFDASRTTSWLQNIWIGEGELSVPEAYGKELEVLGPLRVGCGYRVSSSYSVTDIDILADLTA